METPRDAPPAPPSDPPSAGREPAGSRLPRGAVPVLVFLGATVLGLVEASQVQYDRAVQGAPITWGHALIHGLPRWYAWAALLPAILAGARWIHGRTRAWPARLAAHAGAGAAFTLAQVFLFSTVSTALHGGPGLLQHLRPAFLKYVGLTFLGGLVTYAVLVLGWYAWRAYSEGRRREREAARLELRTAELKALLAEAQLGRLQSQLQPHFLFNALHTLGALIRSGDRAAAARMTQRLSQLLRRSLVVAGRPEITLGEELELVGAYLDVQRVRFGDRLRVDIDVERESRDALLPTLILQPLVENAIEHGIERSSGAGRVAIRARRRDGELVVTVTDDGPGPSEGGEGGAGIGLGNGRARLRELYGSEAELRLGLADGGGAEARLALPFHTEPVASAGPVPAEPEPLARRSGSA